jgi:hypothetical protein
MHGHGRNHRYLALVMLRQLLTVFAILTGLAAAGTPAQANVRDVASVTLVAAAEQSAPCADRRVQQQHMASRPQRLDGATAPVPWPHRVVVLPTVMLGADRALE